MSALITVPRSVAGCATAVLMLVSLAGCSMGSVDLVGASTPESSLPPASSAPIKSATPGPTIVVEPFSEVFALRSEHGREVWDAQQVAIAACMKERGFDYTPNAYIQPSATPVHIGDEEYATQEGFGLSADTVAPVPEGPKNPDPSTGAAWTEALFGPPIDPALIVGDQPLDESIIVIDNGEDGKVFYRKNSCISIGEQAVVGDVVEWDTLFYHLQTMRNDVVREVEADPRYIEAMAAWVSCMQADGYGAKTREQHVEELWDEIAAEGKESKATKQKEIAIATAAAKCEISLGIGPLYQQLLDEHETTVRQANEGTIIRFGELAQQAAERASDLRAPS